MDIHRKSIITLELPIVLEMLAAEAVSETAKENARLLFPVSETNRVRYRLEETSAAKNMMTLRGSPPFSGVKDINGAVKRAEMSGILSTRELLDIAGLLRAAAASIAYGAGEKKEEKTSIDHFFTSLRGNKYLETKISSAIIAEDEIADTASRDLSDIRRHMRISGEKIRQTLNKIITSPGYSKALQEPIITMKNDRYVVPVKAEQKNAVPGLVHDISSSGATLFVEPMAVVQINNELRELAVKEKQEIDRILAELTAEVASHGLDIVSDFDLLTVLDLIFAKAKLSYKLNAAAPEVSEDSSVLLKKARHPLLPEKETVPIDIRIGGEFDTLVITGPNTGGKTVALKTLGLLSAMVQCGLHIPVADGSRIAVFESILADIGDEQSIEQSLSTFSSHMTNIVEILKTCGSNSLALFDELGAGTDPVEGAALAISIIEHLRKRGALIAATTHYAELKTYAVNSPGVVNASCEFDIETLKPTYRLIIGIPGKSNAFAISQRLGLTEDIIEDAKSRVDTGDAAFEDAVASLETVRLSLETERLEATRLLRDAEGDRRKAEEYRKRLESEREKATVIAKREASHILDAARETADSIIEELRDMRRKAASEADWKKLNEEKAELFRRLNEAESGLIEDFEQENEFPQRKIVQGDRVKLMSLGVVADVISVTSDGVLSLQAGIMKVTARENEVRLMEKEVSAEIKKHLIKTEAELKSLSSKPELDLRGMAADEAIPELERFLDSAHLANLNNLTVIHGKGTGVLRQAVHRHLKTERFVKSYRLGKFGEGEDGVTIIEMKQ